MGNLLERIMITQPCRESWDEMSGNAEVRFCSHCSKDVHDLSSMTRARAEQLVLGSGGQVCVRYVKQKTIVITPPPRPTQITRRATIAAGLLTGALACSSGVTAQTAPPTVLDTITFTQQVVLGRIKIDDNAIVVSGVVVDPNGAVIPGASVTLLNLKSKWVAGATTDHEGRFEFKDIEVGYYELEISGVAGFSNLLVQNIAISESMSMTQVLQPSPTIEYLLGVVGIVDLPEVTTEAVPSTLDVQPRPLTPSRQKPPAKKKTKLPK